MVLVISDHSYIIVAPLPAIVNSSCHPLQESKNTCYAQTQSEISLNIYFG